MLARCVFTVWGVWLGALGLATALTASRIWNPDPILPVGLAVLMLAASVGLVTAATVRLIRGPRRDRALAGLLAGTAPLWFLVGHVLTAMRPAFDRHAAPGWPVKVLAPLARPLADLEARWFYPERTRGKWVTMVGATAEDARAQVAAMDRHVEASLARLDQSSTWPIVWNRGPLFGLRSCAVQDMAIGSEVGQYRREADGLNYLDRHEVAHCVITRNDTAWSDPPRLLMEGWAQANQGTPAEELADAAWDDREKGLSLSLRRLVAPDWYWYSGPQAYNQGAPLVDYLLRVYGPERFLKLYTTCQQDSFESDLRACLGVGLDELDAAYWADVERIVRTGPPARRWLKGLKLDSGVDPAAWDAFLADYFAAAARLVAPYDQVRMTTTFRIVRGINAGRDDPHEYEERLSLLRSGPFARVRRRVNDFESATLAHPDHSLGVYRELVGGKGTWTLREDDSQATPRDAYRRALEAVESASRDNSFIATHGGAALLQYTPQDFRDSGSTIPDYGVARLTTSTSDGRRLVTLELRSVPEVKSGERKEWTFVFDADDLFVVRSIQYGDSRQGPVSDRFEYDHQDGRPVLRSFVRTTPAENRSIRLDVEDCRFTPISEAEFALEPFLASLGPGRPSRQPTVDSSTATLLDWYWLAFVGGGISLVGASGLALRAD